MKHAHHKENQANRQPTTGIIVNNNPNPMDSAVMMALTVGRQVMTVALILTSILSTR